MRRLSFRRKGALRVTQQGLTRSRIKSDGSILMRDFDNEEWTYSWITIQPGILLLRLSHDNPPDEEAETFEFVEFTPPVSIEFIAET